MALPSQALTNAAAAAQPHLAEVLPGILPLQATANASPQAHLPTGLPATDSFHFTPGSLPQQIEGNVSSDAHLPTNDTFHFTLDTLPHEALDNAAPQAQPDLPSDLPFYNLPTDLPALLNEILVDVPPLSGEAPTDLAALVAHLSDGLLT